ncbi:MAG TPA: TetR/AcrR family transcriptional regulator [Melioribacteraceae bacterium]|nr:TetR/AcrR family transcriptional regulator [Melioribacteraceae bacterium]
MAYDIEVKQRILTKAEEMFFQFGFTKVTMEEIASLLSISKKTLYKHFNNKEHILKEIVQNKKCEIETFVDKLVADNSIDFVEKLNKFLSFITSHFSKLSHPNFQDLVKSHPDIWNDIQAFRRKNAYLCFSKLINQGKESGVFRNDFNSDVAVQLYFSAIHGMLNLESLARLPVTANEAYTDIVKILFEGIFSDKGREKYRNTNLINENNGVSLT